MKSNVNENNVREIGELKLQLKLVEETRDQDNISSGTHRSSTKSARGGRGSGGCTKGGDRERDAVQAASNELRRKVKKVKAEDKPKFCKSK